MKPVGFERLNLCNFCWKHGGDITRKLIEYKQIAKLRKFYHLVLQ
jgi:hypothetical protein